MRNLTIEEMDLVSGGTGGGGADVLAAVHDICANVTSSINTGDVTAASGNAVGNGNSVSTGDIASGNTTNVGNGSLNGNANGLCVSVLGGGGGWSGGSSGC
jgi:hypothetical protein